MAEKTAYSEAAQTGKYDRPTGLLGKYDNVRRFWEDRITAAFLAPALSGLVDTKRRDRAGLRILDLGCGSGDGLDLLTGVSDPDASLLAADTSILSRSVLGQYVGLDINEELIRQAEATYRGALKTRFVQGDLSNGLPSVTTSMVPFDLYFAGYGTLSHFTDEQCARIIGDICAHARAGAVFVGDWLGRYSYEWQDLWHHPVSQQYFMDYRITYIYPEQERHSVEVTSFPLRLMTRDEIMAVTAEAESRSRARLTPLTFFDRSILVGRHMDTGDYNQNCVRLRHAVNTLLEQYRRTDLDSLMISYVPVDGFDELNSFFDRFFAAWNSLVRYTKALLEQFGQPTPSADPGQGASDSVPVPLKEAMEAIRQVVDVAGSLSWCEARANLIEPTLAYCLRKLEMELQMGLGVGHGLIGVFRIEKQ